VGQLALRTPSIVDAIDKFNRRASANLARDSLCIEAPNGRALLVDVVHAMVHVHDS
jgi:hypothetical protein